jgi:hypothetical protein
VFRIIIPHPEHFSDPVAGLSNTVSAGQPDHFCRYPQR